MDVLAGCQPERDEHFPCERFVLQNLDGSYYSRAALIPGILKHRRIQSAISHGSKSILDRIHDGQQNPVFHSRLLECDQRTHSHFIILSKYGVDAGAIGLYPILHQVHRFSAVPLRRLFGRQLHAGVAPEPCVDKHQIGKCGPHQLSDSRDLAAEHACGEVAQEFLAPSADCLGADARPLRRRRRRIVGPPVRQTR
jgi:hypothetical protein